MDEMPEVTQRFVADVEEYVAEVHRAAGAGAELAGSAEEVKLAAGGMRDKLLEAAAALKITRDEEGKLRDKAGEVITATELQARALKHLRDEALGAAWAQRELDKYQKEGLLSRLGGLLGGGAKALGPGSSLTEGIPMIGAGGPVGIAAIATAIQYAVVEVAALATGLTAAAAGVGSFALLAAPAFSKVHGAYTQIQADQNAYNRALTSKERATAMAHLKQDWAQLDPAQRNAVQGVQQLTGEFHKLSTAFEPTAFKVFGEALKIANQLMPTVAQFATAAAPGITQFLDGISKFISGQTFKHFTDFLSSLSGPSIAAIGSGLTGIVGDVIKLMELFSKKDVINSINIAFRLLGFALTVLMLAIEYSMKEWDLLTKGLHNDAHYFDDVRHAVAELGHDVAVWFDRIRHWVAEAAHEIATKFDEVRHKVAEVLHWIATKFDEFRHTVAHEVDNVVTFFKNLPGNILHALGNLGSLLWNAGVSLITGLWNGINGMLGQLYSYVAGIAHNISSAFSSALHIFSPSRVFYEHGRNTLLGYIQGIQAVAPQVHAALAAVGGGVAAGGLPGVTGVGAAGAIGGGHLNVTVTVAPGAGSIADARWLQGLQQVFQEAALRYNVLNPNNGLAIPGGRL